MNKEELQLKIQEITNYILNEKFDNFDEYENHQNNIINYFLEVASTIDDEQCAIFIKEMTANVLPQKIEKNSLWKILSENELWLNIVKRTRKYIF